jgi:hypothetical protein
MFWNYSGLKVIRLLFPDSSVLFPPPSFLDLEKLLGVSSLSLKLPFHGFGPKPAVYLGWSLFELFFLSETLASV